MKNHLILSLFVIILLSSCKGGEPNQPHVYDSNPQYTWGYAQFYGAYYADVQNTNNVLSVSLFSDSLYINEVKNLVGQGQYLFLEDVFVSASDTLLPEGTYKASESGKPFTFSPGKNYVVDEKVYTLGATINYFEENANMSTVKLIADGSFTVHRKGEIYTVVCNFVTDDSIQLKGSFTGTLPHEDESLESNNPARSRVISERRR